MLTKEVCKLEAAGFHAVTSNKTMGMDLWMPIYLGQDTDICFDMSSFALDELTETARFSFIVVGVLGTSVAAPGVLANFVALLHLLKDICKTTLHPYVAALTFWDIALMVTSWVANSLILMLGHGHIPDSGNIVRLYPYGHASMGIALSGAIWTSCVIITSDCLQYLEWKPRAKYPHLWLGGILLLAVAFHIPSFFEVQLHECCSLATSTLIPTARRAQFAELDTPYAFWYKVIAYIVLVVSGPIFVQVGIIILTAVWLRKTGKKVRNKTSGPQIQPSGEAQQVMSNLKANRRMRKVLLVIQIKFLLCYIPHAVSTVAGHTGDIGKNNKYRYFADLSQLIIIAHSATNGILYLILNREPRQRASSVSLMKRGRNGGHEELELSADLGSQIRYAYRTFSSSQG